ncbi:hypothetical protein HY463_01675 [Candidatus Peregrinibacteria bacterium]|nr:hypothetical protein [Candidatus Peregrinibacteria bacterium]
MQKFTVFSILLSISVLLILSDMMAHNYLSPEEVQSAAIVSQDSVLQADEISPAPEAAISNPFLDSESQLEVAHFQAAGFMNPVLKEAVFDGNIFTFINFADQTDALVREWNLFEGEVFVGSVYEVDYPSETGGFQGYVTLRDRARTLKDSGDVNETGNYGDSSFYFNHKIKNKTVHLVIREGKTLYAFQYAYTYHDTMKRLFELISG